ncbi:MAG: right-handed parallel beta-helix repeat-containing protein [Candidatus Hermodarchaeia archaeon]|jgi:parallel beta-helix repeat protein
MVRRDLIVGALIGAIIVGLPLTVVYWFWWCPPCAPPQPCDLCGPIRIESDTDFLAYRFPGSGTEDDPYIIECRAIVTDEDYGIYISLTSKYFVIRQCYVDAAVYGIYLEGIMPGTAEIEETVCNHNVCGIYLFNSNSTLIQFSECNENEIGIMMEHCGYNTVADTTCNYNSRFGVNLISSEICRVAVSDITDNTFYGICLNSSYDCILQNNSIQLNNQGIYLDLSDDCTIEFNIFNLNTIYGVYLVNGSNGNTIHHNNFYDNNLGGSSQAFTEDPSNTWYMAAENEGNFWSDWISGPYDIDGGVGAQDIYPLSSPVSI